ncbi:MAG: hypothetical protein FADNKDHG_01317 [Holosporales bacterium]
MNTNIFNKHLATVHNCSPLTAIQRKMMNLLIKNAGKKIEEDKEHELSIKSIMDGVGWSSVSNVTEHLKECLKDLVSIKIEWNVLDQDKKARWDTSTLLASAAITDGVVYYSFSISLRHLLANPNIYARLDLDVQKLLKNKYSVLFWEYIIGELSSKKQTSITTEWLTYEKILKLTCLEKSSYKNRYAQFIDLVLKKAINEINAYSDTEINFEKKKQKNKITHIRFHAQKKSAEASLLYLIKEEPEDPLFLKLSSIGLSEKIIRTLMRDYTTIEIENAIDFFKISFSDGGIKNPVAFFKKTLAEGWLSDEAMAKNRLLSVEKSDTSPILDQNDAFYDLKKCLMDLIGEEMYKKWWSDVVFKLDSGDLYVYAKSQFFKDWIEGKYGHDLLQAITLSKSLVRKVIYNVTVQKIT